MIKIIVPATSANLGVGYDCLGLAITRWSTFEFKSNDKNLSISGCPKEFQNSNNLVYKAFVRGCEALNVKVPNVSININTTVPVSRGLGSSATCVVSGLVAAGKWHGRPFTKEQLLTLATKMEGHPDNVAPAIYGGLCLTVQNSNKDPQIIKYQINSNYYFLTVVPDFKVRTSEARAVLPKKMTYDKVTYQISHALLMINSLQNGKINDLKNGLADQMQQPYRAKLIPGFETVQNICDKLKSANYISGSGSTIMVISSSIENRDKIKTLIQNKFPKWNVFNTSIDGDGVKTKEMN